MAYRFGDVLLVPIHFPDATGEKKRPVLVVVDTGDIDLLVAPITSHPGRGPEDVSLAEWQSAALRLPSTSRMSKLATVAKSSVVRQLGRLAEVDLEAARETVRRVFREFS